LDCFQGEFPSMAARPRGSVRQLVEAAKLLASRESAVDPAWRADPWGSTIGALATDGNAYAGVAHLDASLAVNQAGRGREAFDALASGAWWFFRQANERLEPSGSAALALSEELGWDDTARLLRRLLDLAAP